VLAPPAVPDGGPALADGHSLLRTALRSHAFLCARPKPTVKSSRQYVGEIPYSSAAPCLATQLSHSLTPCLNQIARHQQGKPGKVNWTLISVVATMTTAPCLGTSMPSPDLDKLGCRHDARKARLWLGHDAREALRLRRLLIDSVGLPAGFGDALEIGIRQRIDIAVAE
jgi:hypothetical protein